MLRCLLQRYRKCLIFLTIFIAAVCSSVHAEEIRPSIPQVFTGLTFNRTTLGGLDEWTKIPLQKKKDKSLEPRLKLTTPVIIAGVFCFVASSLSSAGGIGGGGLFIPILTIVAGLDLKTASSFSAFMVTGGSIPNVVSNMFITTTKKGHKTLIDYDIALLSEPCMLLGVSIGVLCNLMFPEWLITIMFAVFLAWSTFKTFGAGIFHWKRESELMNNRNGCQKLEIGINEDMNDEILEEPLLHLETTKFKLDIPWMKLGVLTMIWFSFLLLYLLRGNRYGQGIIPIKACGIGYWIISATQIPLTVIFTCWILYSRRESLHHNPQIQSEVGCENKSEGPVKLIFPVMAFLAGSLGGVFGVGGGMLISPLLLQVGITPQVTAATCSFMVFFSSTMSAIQYVLLGMDNIAGAMSFSVICFSGSVIGLVILQQAIEKRGRASLIVFSVGIVLALSTVLMTSFGAVNVWKDYINGRYMGFKQPC